ncbi:MAG: hypothetical protein DRP11_02205, partial [Candidatus Aenigmatarchaeota archaeon]
MFREWRVWLLVIFVAVSIFLIAPNPWAKGVRIVDVKDGSPLKGVVEKDDIITWVNERTINSPEDLLLFENYTGMLRMTVNGELKLVEVGRPGLGVEVEKVSSSRIKLGIDLVGGTRLLLKPELNKTELNVANITEDYMNSLMDQLISTLQTRMNIYGLKEMVFQPVRDVEGNWYVQIETAGASKEEIDELLSRQGEFEAYITRSVELVDGKGTLVFGNESYEIYGRNGTLILDNESYSINDTFVLQDVTFKVWNVTDDKAVLAARVFTSEDIKYVYFSSRYSYVQKVKGGWRFQFQILISQEGAERFAKVTSDLEEVTLPGRECHLSEMIYLFLDEKPISSLTISCGLKGQAYTTPVINGGGETEKEARQEMTRLQSVLRSGALPAKLEVVKIERISPTLGREFMKSLAVAGVLALIAVSVIVFLRYRHIKIAGAILLTSFSEIVIILGAAALLNKFWTIDLAAIAGIIAAIGSGVDHQIVITDETLGGRKEKYYSIKMKVKMAFFIIFGSAATTISAM